MMPAMLPFVCKKCEKYCKAIDGYVSECCGADVEFRENKEIKEKVKNPAV